VSFTGRGWLIDLTALSTQ